MALYSLPVAIDWVAAVKQDYVAGNISIEQLEGEVWEILHGGIPERMWPQGLSYRQNQKRTGTTKEQSQWA